MEKLAFILLFLLVALHSVGQQASHYREAYKLDSLHHDYKSAVKNHIKYIFFDDSEKKADQRKKMAQLLIKYSTQKKDRDIRLLQQQQLTEQTRIKQNKLTRGIMITGAGVLVFIIALLYRQYRIRQRGNTAFRNSNHRLQQVIDEKEWLLKEVHHRVKNNLHTVICLLESQSRYLKDDALKAIEISQHRIYAISLVHQHLYQSTDMQTVDMQDFVKDFVHYIGESMAPRVAHRLIRDIGAVKLDVMHAVPVALMINEAVVDLLAADSASGKDPEIGLFLHQLGELTVLRISGAGNYASSGINLIRKLAEGIGGDLTLPGGKGAYLEVVFGKYSICAPSLRTSPGKKSSAIVKASLTIGALGFLLLPASGQTLSAAETVKNYSLAQKRLLVINTCQFANLISQGILDPDSLMAMACRFTGMPLLLPYTEGLDSDSVGRIPAIIRQAIAYLHRPGTRKQDLDSAAFFIDEAARISKTDGKEKWLTECTFLRAELLRQQGNLQLARGILVRILSSGKAQSDALIEARTCQMLARFAGCRGATAMRYMERAHDIYLKENMPEKQIEMLMDFFTAGVASGNGKLAPLLLQMLVLMRTTGFEHRLFVENLLAYMMISDHRYVEALEHANAGMANRCWSGIDGVRGAFWIRLGSAYETFEENEKAFRCFKAALDSATAETHIFWYKSLFFATTLMYLTGREKDAITLLEKMTEKFPPLTPWEKMKVLSIEGLCYDHLHKVNAADSCYMALLRFARKHPGTDTYGEFVPVYWEIARFYIPLGDLKKASLFVRHATPGLTVPGQSNYVLFDFLFAMDSAKGKFKAALKDHIRYKECYDSTFSVEQKREMDELTVRNDAEKKDQDLRILQQQSMIRQTQLRRDELARGLIFGSIASLLLIASLLFHQFRLKQRTYREMKRKNHLLQGLIKEKAWLLKEVQLRVKDNLQTVISLLGAQAVDLQDDALNAIGNCQRRIYAMSLIHQKLYHVDSEKAIDMSDFVPELVRYLESSFGTDGNIRFELDIQQLQLDATQAVAVAMIINEATTNSIKYAFPGTRTGTITIQMARVKNTITLAISDNGVGMPHPTSKGSSKTLGTKLMQGLSEDLGATLTIHAGQGTSVILQMDAGRITASSWPPP